MNKGLKKYIEFLYVHLTGGEITPERNRKVPKILKEKIDYYFGVPEEELRKANNLGELIKTTAKYHSRHSDFNSNLINELEEMLSLKMPLIQNQKINPNPNLIRGYFPCILGF